MTEIPKITSRHVDALLDHNHFHGDLCPGCDVTALLRQLERGELVLSLPRKILAEVQVVLPSEL